MAEDLVEGLNALVKGSSKRSTLIDINNLPQLDVTGYSN